MFKNIIIFVGGAAAGAYVMYNSLYKKIVSVILDSDDDETEPKADGKEEAEDTNSVD